MTGYIAVRRPGTKPTRTSNTPSADKEYRQIDVVVQALYTTPASGCGYPLETYAFSFPARNSIPGTWALSKLPDKSRQFRSALPCLITFVLLLPFMCRYSNPQMNRTRRGRRCPVIRAPCPPRWRARRRTRLKNYWTPGVGEGLSNIWSTGRDAAQRNVPGSMQRTLWIPASSLIFIKPTRIDPLPDHGGDPDAACLLAPGVARRGGALSQGGTP